MLPTQVPTTNESNEARSTHEPRPVVVSDSTDAAPSKISTCFTPLAGLAFIYSLIVTTARISTGSLISTSTLAIYWTVSTLSSWGLLLLGMWSARTPGREYVRYFRCTLLGLYTFLLFNGLSILDKKLSMLYFCQIVYY